jgi:phosphatidyl-myo-inositol alpha-mannosyltransferase
MAERPLRIAMISYYLPSGSKIGVGYQAHELANELSRRGHAVDMFSSCPPVDGASYGHHRIVLLGAGRTFRFAFALRKIDFSGYDVLHAHGDDYWLWRRRVPAHIRTVHGSCFEEALRIRGTKERLRMLLLGFSEVLASLVADQTAVVSPETRRWLPWVRQVIPNGVDTRRFRPDPARRRSYPVVLFVGTWNGRKRGSQLAQIFAAQVRPRVENAELWMVARDAPADAGEGVRILGELSDVELVDAYQRAWVFCLPSSYEGFGIPYVEAMASRLPVVATRNVGARYVTVEGRYGVLTDLSSLGTCLTEVLLDEGFRKHMADDALQAVDRFSLHRVVDRYVALYHSVLAVNLNTGDIGQSVGLCR